MKCKAEVQTLVIAQLKRSEAQLRELMETEKALHEIKRCVTNLYDWTDVCQARRDVLHWEARCDRAETALKQCVGSARN